MRRRTAAWWRHGVVVVAAVVLAGCGSHDGGSLRAAEPGAKPNTPGTDSTVPPATEPDPTATAPAERGVQVRVQGDLRRSDGGPQLCPGGVHPCWDIRDAADELPTGYVEVEGRWLDDTIRLTSRPTPVEPSSAAFPNPCPEAEGMGGENGDDAVVARAQEHGERHPDEFAGLWLARPGPVVVVAVTANVDRHREALDHPSICVTDEGFRYPLAELGEVQSQVGARVEGWSREGWSMESSSVAIVENVVEAVFDQIDPRFREQLDPSWEGKLRIRAYVEVLEGTVGDLHRPPGPEEIPIRTRGRSGGGMGALGHFVLRYDAGRDCIYLESGDERVTPVWRFGTRALRDPVRVLDPDGTVVAHVDEAFEAGGGSTGSPDPDDPLSCGGKTVWIF